MRRVIPSLVLAGLLGIFAPVVAAHEISDVTVDCPGETIVVTGIKFGDQEGITVTLTGPGGYLETYLVMTDTFVATFPLGPNGDYSVDWPDSDGWGPFEFVVDCAEPTESPTGGVLPTESAGATPTESPTGGVLPTESTAPTGGVAGATATPDVTLPPTDTTSGTGPTPDGLWPALAILAIVAVTSVFALPMAAVPVRERRRRHRR